MHLLFNNYVSNISQDIKNHILLLDFFSKFNQLFAKDLKYFLKILTLYFVISLLLLLFHQLYYIN